MIYAPLNFVENTHIFAARACEKMIPKYIVVDCYFYSLSFNIWSLNTYPKHNVHQFAHFISRTQAIDCPLFSSYELKLTYHIFNLAVFAQRSISNNFLSLVNMKLIGTTMIIDQSIY